MSSYLVGLLRPKCILNIYLCPFFVRANSEGSGETEHLRRLGSPMFCLFVWFDSLRPINNISVIKGRVFLG